MNSLVQVHGIIRKATDVRPKIEEAAFECQLCGTLSRIPQSSGDFQEPHECQGCERQGPSAPTSINPSSSTHRNSARSGEPRGAARRGNSTGPRHQHRGTTSPARSPRATTSRRSAFCDSSNRATSRTNPLSSTSIWRGLSVEVDEEQFEDMDITGEDKEGDRSTLELEGSTRRWSPPSRPPSTATIKRSSR